MAVALGPIGDAVEAAVFEERGDVRGGIDGDVAGGVFGGGDFGEAKFKESATEAAAVVVAMDHAEDEIGDVMEVVDFEAAEAEDGVVIGKDVEGAGEIVEGLLEPGFFGGGEIFGDVTAEDREDGGKMGGAIATESNHPSILVAVRSRTSPRVE